MKKIISLCLLVVIVFTIVPNDTVLGQIDINTIVNGENVVSENKSMIINNRTMVPLRDIGEKLGFSIKWNGAEKTVTLENEGNELLISIGKKETIFNGSPLLMDTPSFIHNNVTYVPLRFISETFEKEVNWDEKNKVALVGDYTKSKSDFEVDTFKYNSSKHTFSIKIPNKFEERLIIKEKEDKIEFYDKYNYQIDGGLGRLFTILKTQNPNVLGISPSYVLKYEDGLYYIAVFASDVQYIVDNEKSEKSYSELIKASEDFLRSFVLE